METTGTLEEQLTATQAKSAEVRARKADLRQIEELGAKLEERLILDNRYTEHSTRPGFSHAPCSLLYQRSALWNRMWEVCSSIQPKVSHRNGLIVN
ncbi:unnamed protein product [Protopolystoma xenopodis]|uniref:Uncharacterized protein n=1 Tax=Protopolystoma xenopodis TaxID=117903 RepID=A0A3S5BFE9_9PLAT|nr:unnamed protein product [Protopolystoma xenopodis]